MTFLLIDGHCAAELAICTPLHPVSGGIAGFVTQYILHNNKKTIYIIMASAQRLARLCLSKRGEGEKAVKQVMPDDITFRAVSAENWTDFESLFQKRGAPKSCWCTAWRKIRAELKDDPSAKKHEMEKRIRGGEPVGILGYGNGDPIAWCSVSPRDTYRSSMADALDGDEHETIWSIVCFFVMGHFRGKGLFTRLIGAAERHAAQSGATVLEAYPVDPDSPSYRFGGFLPVFEALGYKKIGRKGARRYVVRKSIK